MSLREWMTNPGAAMGKSLGDGGRANTGHVGPAYTPDGFTLGMSDQDWTRYGAWRQENHARTMEFDKQARTLQFDHVTRGVNKMEGDVEASWGADGSGSLKRKAPSQPAPVAGSTPAPGKAPSKPAAPAMDPLPGFDATLAEAKPAAARKSRSTKAAAAKPVPMPGFGA